MNPTLLANILGRIQERAGSDNRANLSHYDTSEVLCFIKLVAEECLGRPVSQEEMSDKLGFGKSDSSQIRKYMRFSGGKPIAAQRGMKFDTARDVLCNALCAGWLEIEGDVLGNAYRITCFRQIFQTIREEEIAFSVLHEWKRKKRGTMKRGIWEADIIRVEKEVLRRDYVATKRIYGIEKRPGMPELFSEVEALLAA